MCIIKDELKIEWHYSRKHKNDLVMILIEKSNIATEKEYTNNSRFVNCFTQWVDIFEFLSFVYVIKFYSLCAITSCT